MTSPDVVFARIVIGSVAAFALLALAYFRLFGHRAKVAVARLLPRLVPVVGVAALSRTTLSPR